MVDDFVKGASGPENVYDTSPSGLGLSPAYLAQGASASASANASPEISYSEKVSAFTTTAVTEGTAVAVVDSVAATYDGSPVLVHFYSPAVYHSVALAEVIFTLWEGASVKGIIGRVVSDAASDGDAASLWYRFTPSAASHTYTIKAHGNVAGTCTVQAGAGGSGTFFQMFLRVTKA